MEPLSTSPSAVRTQLRLPPNLHDWLRQTCRAQHRSMNGQIVELLEAAKRKAQEAQQA